MFYNNKVEERIKVIELLEDDWDEDGASKPTQKVIQYLKEFLNEYKIFITPDINVCHSGTIHISFDKDKIARMLITIGEREDGTIRCGYYFDEYSDETSYQGTLDKKENKEDMKKILKFF